MGEMALHLLKGCARVADEDGREFHLSPYLFEGDDERGVLSGIFLKPLVASEVLAESDFDEDEVALLTVESDRVRRRGVRYSSGVNEVWGCAVSRPKKGLLGLEGKYPVRDAGRGLRAFQVSDCGGLIVPPVSGDIGMYAGSSFDFRWERLEPIR